MTQEIDHRASIYQIESLTPTLFVDNTIQLAKIEVLFDRHYMLDYAIKISDFMFLLHIRCTM